MKLKIFFTVITALVLLTFSNNIKAQDDMDFEEFMGMMSETMTSTQLDELSYLVPWNIRVLGYAVGDFSGDGVDDIVLSIFDKDKTPSKSTDVYFFKSIEGDKFKRVKKKNYKWYEVTLEVAFLVKEGKCFVTNRDDNSWYFTGFEIKDDKLVQAEVEKFPIEFENAGK
jgi:hypothetical protein